MDDYGHGLWAVGDHRLGGLHLLRPQLLSRPPTGAAGRPGGRSLHRRPAHQDVWLPSHDLPAHQLDREPLRGLYLSSSGRHLWTEIIGGKVRPHLSPSDLVSSLFIGGGLAHRQSLARAVGRCPTQHPRHHRALRPGAPHAVCWVPRNHGRASWSSGPPCRPWSCSRSSSSPCSQLRSLMSRPSSAVAPWSRFLAGLPVRSSSNGSRGLR